MNMIIFLILAMLEYIIIVALTDKLTKLKEYITINYSSFEFSNIGHKPYGLNILIKIVFPSIFMVIIAGILYNIGKNDSVENIFLISIFYYLIRWFIIIFVYNRQELMNWKEEICIFCITITINVLLYYFFIKKTTQIFISLEELRDAIWISIVTFIVVIIRDFIYNYLYIDNYKLENRKEKYILKRYEHFKNKYYDIVVTKNKELHTIVYAIMIYENYNRPFFVRTLEKIKFLINGKATLGIMQVKTRFLINDRTSVKIGYNILKKNYFKNKKKMKQKRDIVNETIYSYNYGEKYLNEVLYIKKILENTYN